MQEPQISHFGARKRSVRSSSIDPVGSAHAGSGLVGFHTRLPLLDQMCQYASVLPHLRLYLLGCEGISIFKTKTCFSEMSVPACKTMWRHMPGHHHRTEHSQYLPVTELVASYITGQADFMKRLGV
jgi:hypothetical protein